MTTISRRSTIAALASSVAAPATIAAPMDPALDLVRRYRSGMDAFNKTPEFEDRAEEARAIAATYGGPWLQMVEDFPIPSTRQGAIETARLLIDEQASYMTDDAQRNLAAALLAYLECP